MKYEDFIKDKKIIFIGPSPYLIGQNLGKYFDSFDLIVRTNGSVFMGKELHKDYGSRLDILYVNVQFMREACPLDFFKIIYNIKYFCTKTRNKGAMANFSKKAPARDFSDVISVLNEQVQGLLTGTAIIYDILRFNPKELHIVGMDFYSNKPPVFIPDDWREYYPGYLPKVTEKLANVKNLGRRDPHNYASNAKMVNRLQKTFPNLSIDEHCQNRINELINN